VVVAASHRRPAAEEVAVASHLRPEAEAEADNLRLEAAVANPTSDDLLMPLSQRANRLRNSG
jgi:hypothetical protein